MHPSIPASITISTSDKTTYTFVTPDFFAKASDAMQRAAAGGEVLGFEFELLGSFFTNLGAVVSGGQPQVSTRG